MNTVDRLGSFLDSFAHCFGGTNVATLRSLRGYLEGLLTDVRRKNVERIAEAKEGAAYQNYQYAVSEAGWSHTELIDGIAAVADELLGGDRDAALLIDEFGNAKKGTKSVGVARQWNGRLGKVDNCQVAVAGVLCARASCCPVDIRLFLPGCWSGDADRCGEAGVPEGERAFRTKLELALEIVDDAVGRGVRFRWVGMDAFYGRSRGLLAGLEDRGHTFVGDIPKNHRVRLPGAGAATRADALAATLRFRRVTLRPAAGGPLVAEAAAVEVEVKVRAGDHRRWWLLATRDPGGGNIKYSLTNSAAPLARKAFMQRQRYWVERSFQDAKTSCGMSQYQVRGWVAWHHHMALVMLAMLFLLEERVAAAAGIPLLSCPDIVSILHSGLKHAGQTDEACLDAMRNRHRQRYNDMAGKWRKAAGKPPPKGRKAPLTK